MLGSKELTGIEPGFPPRRKPIESVQVRQKNYPLKDVWAMEIPARVFSKLDQYPDDKYLTGIKKHVVFVDIPCEWGRIYQEKLQTIANSFAFQKNYDLTILPAGPKCMSERKDCSTWITKILVDELTCNVEDENTCPSDWANSYCGNGTCIVNPNTREIVVDYSQDINQLPVLLEAYENWEDTVLLPLEK